LETYWNSVDENHRAFVKGGTRSIVFLDTTIFTIFKKTNRSIPFPPSQLA
jgi:hypothetical protein